MILSVIVILVLAAVAFFHYTQGLFPATVSAICAGVAALAAFAFHEPLVGVAGGGALGSYGDAVALVALFAGIYLVLRYVIDNFFPGNVRYPVALDKGGAAVMGLIAGFFASAIVGLAAQQLPFGSSVAMFSRYETADEEFAIPRRIASTYSVKVGGSSRAGSDIIEYNNVVQATRLGGGDPDAEKQSLWLPVDEWFVSLVSKVSGDAGALSGPVAFNDIYPGGEEAYFDAIYGRRLGLQVGAKRVAINYGDRQDVRLPEEGGLFLLTTGEGGQFPGGVPQVAGEDWQNRGGVEASFTPPEGKRLLVVRVLFDNDARDKGGYVHFGPANARLVADDDQYFAIGTMESGRILVASSPDDYLVAPNGADLVFEVDADALEADGQQMPEDAFLEFKELGRIPLDNERIYAYLTADPRTNVVRKRIVQERIGARYLGDDTGRYHTDEGFNQLRSTLPDTAADPATAEEQFLAGQTPAAGPPAATPDASADTPDSPPTDDAPADGEGNGGILDNLRRGTDEFRGQGQGDGN